jgi:regulator of sigma E protease
MDFISGIFSSIWSVFLIVLFFGGSIFVHELGHFLAARRRGVRVERFSIGFGPAIWKWRSKDGVEYRLSWLPLGGYVALPQLADLSAIEGASELDVVALPPISYATKMVVFAAGAFFNVLFAFALACVVWVIGQQTSEDFASTRIGYVAENITLPDGSIVPSPARAAGLRVGDVIRAIDGETVKDWPELLQTLVTSSGMTVDGRREAVFTIERGGKTSDIVVFPRLLTEDRMRKVGISAAYTPIVAEVPEKSYARQLGLQVGDTLTELEHEPLLNLATIYDRLQEKPAREFTLTVRRNGQPVNVTVPADRPRETAGVFGASFRIATSLTHPDPFSQIASQAKMTFRLLLSLFQPHSDITVSKLNGPVGIGKIFWDASEAGFRYVLWIAILVNVNLAIFNLLPIPVLDGGQMLFATIARVRGRALPPTLVATTQSIFMALLLTLILYVSVFDVQRIRRDARADAQAREAAKPADAGSSK